MFFVFFFFKQKTAYEMRISDWSSDVCSSDLGAFKLFGRGLSNFPRSCACCVLGSGRCDLLFSPRVFRSRTWRLAAWAWRSWHLVLQAGCARPPSADFSPIALGHVGAGNPIVAPDARSSASDQRRSEEHTSELQSLMRISYAVF